MLEEYQEDSAKHTNRKQSAFSQSGLLHTKIEAYDVKNLW